MKLNLFDIVLMPSSMLNAADPDIRVARLVQVVIPVLSKHFPLLTIFFPFLEAGLC